MMKSSLFSPRPWSIWKYAWKNRNNRLAFTSFFGVFFLVSIGIPYGITNRISEFFDWTLFDPSLTIDNSIAYIPLLNLAYFSFYAYYVLIPFFASTEQQKKSAIMFSQRMFVATIPVFFIFLLAPVEVNIRAEVAGNDVLTSMLSLIHIVDQPYNAWPSLHVGHSLCVVLCVPLIYNVHRVAYVSLWCAWILLTLSTMTTQQHYLFDVLTGILFALIAHYRFIKPAVEQCNANEFDDAFELLQANKPETSSG